MDGGVGEYQEKRNLFAYREEEKVQGEVKEHIRQRGYSI